ncbi:MULTISPECIES: subunit of meta-cleavage enzyme [Pseudomonadaceae]|uniref:2'-aminobiphenyl-2,3-diol 1,2-dioxygenase CarBa n=5 Tax=Pseudomonadaceae TaxID=135621 RepID=S6AY18_METRE|nr:MULTISPECIES: subunit of meta-cleavage enzyme [Pseudomonadaceae]AAY56340.1 CarBa [Pseudomonas sp. XLDN4-9]BAA21730.1 subunit of meta-cleavage enzyme [Pseudomonas sp.]BAA31268.1 2'-aminobiphenyl-2,3-diol 1,2-dioxygenase [Stutzerimonas stutzeri]BAB32767.1 subunit of meta-cleavage enzyme [Pseudomonas resinovorans]BAC41546.1 subunit of meta-cleavage enzyme [Pseudomonas resinovorans]
MARYEVDRLIQDMSKKEGLIGRVIDTPSDVFEEYGLTPPERTALLEGTPQALASIGVHPILQMHYLMYKNPEMATHVSIKDYSDMLKGGA